MKPKQCLVIGLGRFGSSVAGTLYTLGHEVIAIDQDEVQVQRMMNQVSSAAIADASDEQALAALGMPDFDVVVVAIGELQAGILATLNAKSLGAPFVVSKAVDDTSRRVLEKVGADRIVMPEHDTGLRLARAIANPNSVEGIDLGSDYSAVQLELGRTLTLPDLERHGVNVVALMRQGVPNLSLTAGETLRPHDKVLVVGRNQAIDKLQRLLDRE